MITIDTKQCSCCQSVLPITEFAAKRRQCNKCRSSYQAAYRKTHHAEKRKYEKEWYDKNRLAVAAKGKERYEKHKERISIGQKRWRDKNKPSIHKRVHAWRKANGPRIWQNQKSRMQTDVNYRIAERIRGRIKDELRKSKSKKSTKTNQLLGCSVEQLKLYLESLWSPDMSWSNYGTYKSGGPMTWHIDHIRPIASFDLTDPEQQTTCFHWSNLQPLWAMENILKADSYEEGLL